MERRKKQRRKMGEQRRRLGLGARGGEARATDQEPGSRGM